MPRLIQDPAKGGPRDVHLFGRLFMVKALIISQT
jgi:hypothetical protein